MNKAEGVDTEAPGPQIGGQRAQQSSGKVKGPRQKVEKKRALWAGLEGKEAEPGPVPTHQGPRSW